MGGEFHHEQVASTHVGFEMLQLGLALIDCCMVARYKKKITLFGRLCFLSPLVKMDTYLDVVSKDED